MRKAIVNTAAFSANVPTPMTILVARPKPSKMLPSAARAVVPSTATPTTQSRPRPRNRLASGLGRLLRGTRQIVFIAFCAACATPRPPYRVPRIPIANPIPLPLIPCGSDKLGADDGQLADRRVEHPRCSPRSPSSTKLRIVDESSSSGKIDRKP